MTAILDLTHPYAHRITARTASICAARDLPFLQFLRPPWVAEAGDHWVEVSDEAEAAQFVTPGQTVFLGTGRQTLEKFAGLAGCRVICRQIDPPAGPFPFPGGEYLIGRPPFSVEDEVALFERLKVDWLIVKNAGGAASATKLTAARQLGIPVIMIARPPQGNWAVTERLETAETWARAHCKSA